MEHEYTETGSTTPMLDMQLADGRGLWALEPIGEREVNRELMAPGHLYNPRTGTGIEWLPANPDTGEPGRVRLWSRQWGGKPAVLAEAEHHTGSPWEYWYNLEFANSFPQVTHWWFGDAWTGIVRIWEPTGVGRDPESGAPMLTGWMRFGSAPSDNGDGAPAFPWTVALTNPIRVITPLPPMSTNLANLPLQMLLAERVMEVLGRLIDQRQHRNGAPGDGHPRVEAELALTSLVRREDLPAAFPTEFGPWRLDRLPDLTPREALGRVQGMEPAL